MAHYCITTDFIYFQARENGLAFAVINKENPTSLSNAKSKNPDFSWDPGFKFSFGYFFNHDEWSIYLNFLHYHARITDIYPRREGTFPFPTWQHLAAGPGFVEDIRNRWRLHLGILDLIVQRSLNVSDALQLCPFAGLRYAEIRQKTRIDYFGGTLFPDGQDDIDMKNKFWGLGPMAGLNGFWKLFCDFGLYFNTATSFPYGFFYVHQDERSSLVDEKIRFFRTFHMLRIITEMAAGLRYNCYLNDLNIDCHAGYELFFLWGQNQLVRFLNQSATGNFESNAGDLTLHGWSLGISIGF
ncbi:MAG TPA: Lpg1974 family pore-forming outer membrane protein [Rhabdochlamydiaceae bacterium]|nr:Lpg1974 family pore-forming outer membrane protein [Rhabdochlamydiaceae bacterium]